MRDDRRPYWVKKAYLNFRKAWVNRFLAPACDQLGDHFTIMKPWYVDISGPNIRIGQCATIVAEPDRRVKIAVWGRAPGQGKITIGANVMISPGTRISASDEITIGDGVMLAAGAYVTDSDWHGIYDRTRRDENVYPVVIKDNAWLGDHATVLKGVTIGENSIVAANAVVTRDVPPNVIVAGNPARVVKPLDTEKGFITRNEMFAEPENLEKFFDAVDYDVLHKNGFFNWVRTLIAPNKND